MRMLNMQPAHYFDLDIRSETDLNAPETMSLALRILHGSGKVFALSLPSMEKKNLGEKLRIFSSSKGDLEHIQDRMTIGPLDDYVLIRRIKPVPVTNVFESFTTLNIKSFGSRNARRIRRGHEAYDDETVLKIQEKNKFLDGICFLWVKSKTNNQQFKLFIVRNSVSQGSNGNPDSYGFSSPSNVIALPVFP